MRLAQRWTALLAVPVVLGALAPGTAPGQTPTPPGGTTPGGAIFDRLYEDTTRPPRSMPPPPRAPRAPAGDMLWVPGRHVQVPGVEGQVFVPGHWERRLSEHEVHVPPLTGQTPDGGTVHWPAGVHRPPHERQAP
jgi:hypothetical protein